jgi:lipopolysaccharide export LptBFGC system permease protein LptF
MNKLLLLLLVCCHGVFAQVSSVVRNPASYTQDVFSYKGNRILQVDEVSSSGNEENVFIFSKIEKNAKPDVMYFQRFIKNDNQWKLNTLFEIKYDGIISMLKNRKAFTDADKNKRVDALFIYALNDYDFKQQSVHLLFSHTSKIYSITAYKSDGYAKNIFSDNFQDLTPNLKSTVMEYWGKLDKTDN